MRWDEGSLRGTTRLKTLTRSSEKLGCADLFRRGCAVRLLRRRLTPPARRAADGVRNVCAVGRKLPARRSRAIRLQLGGPAGPPNLPGERGPEEGVEGRGPPKPPGGGFPAGGLASAGRGRISLEGCGPPKPPGGGRRERNAFSPLFAPDIGGGPSGIGRGSAKTGSAPRP